jgi:hypothetical protein
MEEIREFRHRNKYKNCAPAETFKDFVLLISTTTAVFTVHSLLFSSNVWISPINEHNFEFVVQHCDCELI